MEKRQIDLLIDFLTLHNRKEKFEVTTDSGIVKFDCGDWFLDNEAIAAQELADSLTDSSVEQLQNGTYESVCESIVNGFFVLQDASELYGIDKVEQIIEEYLEFIKKIVDTVNKTIDKNKFKVIQ